MKIYIYYLVALLFAVNSLMAQDEPMRKYYTQEVAKNMLKQNLTLMGEKQKMEIKIKQYHIPNQTPSITIPIIIHNIYNSTDQKVSEALIQSQINSLNEAFNLKRGWMHPGHVIENWGDLYPLTTNIQFCLANVKINQNSQEGIHYKQSQVTKWGIDNNMKKESAGGVSPFNPKEYLNIWVTNLGENNAGFAQFPWGPENTDGIVIDYRVFGVRGTNYAPYNKGKTLVHLIGSYLGLNELWNENEPCGDDMISDTPVHNAPNYGSVNTYKHVSTCFNNPVEMTVNYMDATEDDFAYLFTTQQVLRMHAVLDKNGLRYPLTQSSSRCSVNLYSNIIAQSRTENNKKDLSTPSLEIFPNPTKDNIQIKFKGESVSTDLMIYNANGKLVHLIPENEVFQQTYLDVSDWQSGIYFIKANIKGELKNYRFAIAK